MVDTGMTEWRPSISHMFEGLNPNSRTQIMECEYNTCSYTTLVHDIKGGSRNIERGHIVWVFIYMERSDRAHTDADSYTCTQTEQSGNETTKMV